MTPVTVRDAAIEVFRARGLTRMFANPGSTEVPLLIDLPPDLEFVLGLHEGSVVGVATGWAIGRDEPALVLLHTTAGLGNAVGALATARVNRAPLVVLVGQQDRRHLAHEPFLAGHLEGLAARYPVWVEQPVRPQDLPGAIGRAWHDGDDPPGAALVVVPMDDWSAPPAATAVSPRAPGPCFARPPRIRPRSTRSSGCSTAPSAPPSWSAPERTSSEPGTRSSRSQRGSMHPSGRSRSAPARVPAGPRRFAGHLPSDRTRLRAILEPFDAVLVVGAPAFRQYTYPPGPFHGPGPGSPW